MLLGASEGLLLALGWCVLLLWMLAAAVEWCQRSGLGVSERFKIKRVSRMAYLEPQHHKSLGCQTGNPGHSETQRPKCRNSNHPWRPLNPKP